MTQLTYKGFHTCKNKGTYEDIVRKIPFESGDGPNQWLTQGYYFWTDDPYWAKKWGPKQKVIGEFDIELCPERELLDLVGNVKQQRQFNTLKNTVLKTLTKEQRAAITVHQVISYFRKPHREAIFPYAAIKAEDGRCVNKIKFIDPNIPSSHGEEMALVTRQQMCVFTKGREKINLCGFEEPKEFADNFSA
ncbi:hypothetical protein AB6D68_01355 [Vibrio cyclitrophicus]